MIDEITRRDGNVRVSRQATVALTLTLGYININFYIAQTPTVRPRAHYMVIIICYSEQNIRLKRNVFSPRRKATVDFVLFSSVGSWFHARGAAVENARSAIFRFVRGTT